MVIDSLQTLVILTDKVLHPCTLVRSSYFISSNMSFSVERKHFIAVCSIGIIWQSILIFIGVHIDVKKLLKRLAFSLKFETQFLSTNNNGIAGIFSSYSM